MELYVNHISPNCTKVHAVARYLKSPVEVRNLDFQKGELKTQKFLGINPNGKVPALVDGDFKLWESNAICQYLANKAGDTQLFPQEPKKQADVNRWLFWEIRHFNKELETITWERWAKPTLMKQEPDETLLAPALKYYEQYAKVLDQHLTQKTYITGETLTIADFAVGKLLGLVDQCGIPLSRYPNTKKWFSRISEMPCWKESIPNK